jgi:phospholipase DDHD2
MPISSNTSVSYIVGENGIGAPDLSYPQLNFKPTFFFALGSPIAMFLAVRGIASLGEDFHFPTCSGFFNIFHPVS